MKRRRFGASAANRGKRVRSWIESAHKAEAVAAALERHGDAEGAALHRRIAENWTALAGQEAKWAAHYAIRKLQLTDA